MMQGMFIHVGVGKTGTTAFQNNFLENSGDVHNFGRPHHMNDDYRAVYHMLTRAEASDVDWPWLRDWFSQQRESARLNGKYIAVLSDENLLAYVNQPFSLFFERLNLAVPDCHIIISIRNQLDLIRSYWYGHASHLKDVPSPYKNRYVSLRNWLDWQLELANQGRGQLPVWNFYRLDRTIVSIMGEHRVSFVPYESLLELEYEENYSGLMADALGVSREDVSRAMAVRANDSSDRVSPQEKRLKQYVQFVPSIIRRGPVRKAYRSILQKVSRRRVEEIGSEHIQEIWDLYAEGNAALGHLHGLDLKARGYPVS